MKIWTFVMVVFTLTTIQVNAEVFEYKAGNISFDIGSLKYNDIPKPLEDVDSEVSPDARTRRNMMRMVIPFSNVTTL